MPFGNNPTQMDILSTPYGLSGQLSPEIAVEQQALNRKQQIANMLLQQGLQPAQGQMVGRFYVPASPFQHLGNLAQVAAGAFGTSQLDDQRKSLIQQQQQIKADAIRKFMEQTQDRHIPERTLPQGSPEQVIQNQGPPQIDDSKAYGLAPAPTKPLEPTVIPAVPPTQGPVNPAMTVPADENTARRAIIEGMTSQVPGMPEVIKFLESQKQHREQRADDRAFQAEQRGLDRQNRIDTANTHFNQAMMTAVAMGSSMETIERMKEQHAETIKRIEQAGADRRDNVQGSVVIDPKSPTGYSYADLRTGKVVMQGAPVPASVAQQDKKSAGRLLPGSVGNKFMENSQNLRSAENALALISGGTVAGQKGDKDATGLKAYLPEPVLQRVDPSGVPTRAAIANLGSMIIHDRSGAAVTAAEYPRLKPFIPKENDHPDVVKTKLRQFVNEYRKIQEEMTDFYTEAGYNVPSGDWQQRTPIPEEPSAGSVAPFTDAEKEQRYQEWKKQHK